MGVFSPGRRKTGKGFADSMSPDVAVERRAKPRIDGPFPVLVRCTNMNGESFETETVVDNLSAGGFHVRLEHRLDLSASLFALIRFGSIEIEAKGTVKRIEPQDDGLFGFGLAFESYRILPEE
jgi:hypothetical protein